MNKIHAYRILLAASTLVATSSFAATDTWTGTTSASWNNAGNWNTLPVPGDNLTFNAAGTSGTALSNDFNGSSFATLTFGAAAPAYTIGGSAFTLTGGVTNSGTALQTINNAITLSGAPTVTTSAGGGNVTLGGVLGGAGSLTTSGAGITTLSGANTYTGGTTVNGGTLTLANASAVFGSSTNNGGAITVNAGATLNVNNNWNLGNTGSAANAITVNGGTIKSNATNYTNNLTLQNGANVTSDTSANVFRLGYSSNATIVVSGTSASTVASGFSLAKNTGTSVTFNVNDVTGSAATDLTVSGSISDLSSATAGLNLTKSGAGTMVLSAANTYAGSTTVSAGTLVLSNAQALQSSVLTLSGGVAVFDASVSSHSFAVGGLAGSTNLALEDNAVVPNAVALTSNYSGAVQTIYSGVLSGAGSFIKSGSGLQLLGGGQTYTGGTTITGGLIGIGADTSLGALPSSASANNVTLNGGGITTHGYGTSVVIGANRGITLGAAGGTLEVFSSASLTINGVISGAGTLTRSMVVGYPVSDLILNGKNIYTGKTTLMGGTTTIGPAGAIRINGANGITITSGATLAVNGVLNLNSNADSISNAGTLTFAASGSSIVIGNVLDGISGNTYQLISGGTITNAANTIINLTGSSVWSSALLNGSGVVTLTAVPEPSTYGLIGAGSLVAAALVRRRRKLISVA